MRVKWDAQFGTHLKKRKISLDQPFVSYFIWSMRTHYRAWLLIFHDYSATIFFQRTNNLEKRRIHSLILSEEKSSHHCISIEWHCSVIEQWSMASYWIALAIVLCMAMERIDGSVLCMNWHCHLKHSIPMRHTMINWSWTSVNVGGIWRIIFRHRDRSSFLDLGLVDMLREGTVNTYLQFLGQDFFRYFLNFGYGKLFRVAGRTLREFYLAIDQLHDSNRYTFVGMQQPLFHITSEDESGATLNYKYNPHQQSLITPLEAKNHNIRPSLSLEVLDLALPITQSEV